MSAVFKMDRDTLQCAWYWGRTGTQVASATDGGHEGCWLMPNDGTQPAPTAAQEQR